MRKLLILLAIPVVAYQATLATSVIHRQLSDIDRVNIVCNALDLPQEFDLPDSATRACDLVEERLAELALSRGVASHVIGPDERANLTVVVSGKPVQLGSFNGYILKIELSFVDRVLIPRLKDHLQGPYTVDTWASSDADIVSESNVEAHLVDRTMEMARWFFDEVERVRASR